jgi:hypothetical protein
MPGTTSTRTKERTKAAAKKPAITALAARAKALKERALAEKKRRCDELVELIRRRQARITEDFYDIGEALRTILRERLENERRAGKLL